MTKRDLITALVNDESSLDSDIILTGGVFTDEDIDTEGLSIIFINSDDDETTLVVG